MYWYFDNYSHKPFNLKYLGNIINQYNVNNGKNVKVPKTNKDALDMVLEKIENTNYDSIKKDLIRFVTWDKNHLNMFFDNYKNTMYDMIKKYNTNLEWGNNEKKFRL